MTGVVPLRAWELAASCRFEAHAGPPHPTRLAMPAERGSPLTEKLYYADRNSALTAA
jgi:hypothetical protein